MSLTVDVKKQLKDALVNALALAGRELKFNDKTDTLSFNIDQLQRDEAWAVTRIAYDLDIDVNIKRSGTGLCIVYF